MDNSRSERKVISTTSRKSQTLEPDVVSALSAGATFSGVVEGLTHDFYKYPARFSPAFASAAIRALSRPGETVCDIFMGGGTTVVEALAAGRNAVGVDLNALAVFVAEAKTTPLSPADERAIHAWAHGVADAILHADLEWLELPGIKNLPPAVERTFVTGLEGAAELTLRQQCFARAALLRVGQWAMDGRERGSLRMRTLALALPRKVEEMLRGLHEFIGRCVESGVDASMIVNSRRLLNRSSIGLHEDERLNDLHGRVSLCVCSPPYPGVHVLYHRWQHRGRRETAAPYWVTAQNDGYGGAYYTMGGRSEAGLRRYYQELESIFASLRPFLQKNAHVVQLVAFKDRDEDLPRFLQAMRAAGFLELQKGENDRIWRSVPNRKWYNRVRDDDGSDASSEVVLIHRPT